MAIYHSPSGDINNLVVKTGASSVEKLPNILKDQYNRIAKRAKVWNSNEAYKTGDIVLYNDEMYRALKAIPASDTFGPVKNTIDHVETITEPIVIPDGQDILEMVDLPDNPIGKASILEGIKNLTTLEEMAEQLETFKAWSQQEYPVDPEDYQETFNKLLPEAGEVAFLGQFIMMGQYTYAYIIILGILAPYETEASEHPFSSYCIAMASVNALEQNDGKVSLLYKFGNYDWLSWFGTNISASVEDLTNESTFTFITKENIYTEGNVSALVMYPNDDVGFTTLIFQLNNVISLNWEEYNPIFVAEPSWEKILYPDIFYNNLNLENIDRFVDITNLEDPKQVRAAKGSAIWDIQNDTQNFNIKINSFGAWGKVENAMTPPWDLLINKKSSNNVLSRFLIPIGTIENNTFVLNEAFQDTLGDFSAAISEKINQIQNKKILGLFDFLDLSSSSHFRFKLSDLINNILQYNGTITENTKIYYSHRVFNSTAQNSLTTLEQTLNNYDYCFSTYLKNQDSENNTVYLLLNLLQPNLNDSQLNLIGASYNKIEQFEISGQNIISTLKHNWKNLFFWGDSSYEVVFYEEERGKQSAVASNYKPFGFFWFNIIAGDCTTNHIYNNTRPFTVFHKWDD